MSPIIELAIRKTKPGQLNDFIAARNAFLAEWAKSDGVLADREFKSFYALPKPDDTDVFIGMTLWSDMAHYNSASLAFFGDTNTPRYKLGMTFFKLFQPKALLQMQVLEGNNFELKKLASQDGQVLEVAVRKPNGVNVDAFHAKRRAFVDELNVQPGVLAGYEFQVVSENPEGLTVGMTVYADQSVFQAANQHMGTTAVAQAFYNAITPVAVQYAMSVSK